MGALDNFLNIMRLNDERSNDDIDRDDEDDLEYDDDDIFGNDRDDENTSRGKKGGFLNWGKKHDYDDDDDDDDNNLPLRGRGKVTTHPSYRKTPAGVCIIKPTTVDDAREITETLLDGSIVNLNLEGLDLEIAQRIIDFIAGATFAIDGNLQKVSNFIFVVTPPNVNISGDVQDSLNGLNGSLGMPAIRTKY